ncbi:hypothetical protein EV643_115112 [Kribbella sp. VKM Ac-2527]|uniref:Uncharacterized protein n=1 Tax=Kribbella caucasensis TaxID=2512215 RepID=A0A4R6K5R7_9ACTN|nr:hypothetical protein [Kribbella sp. VKM Ac-2527]TDO44612.1 hypothetical protein EV643_115112 [Kribbella sp. VKM Ac-2527]
MAWGKGKYKGQDPENGGWMPGRKAKRAAGSGGGMKGDQVVSPKGKVTGNFAGRQRKQGNEHGV